MCDLGVAVRPRLYVPGPRGGTPRALGPRLETARTALAGGAVIILPCTAPRTALDPRSRPVASRVSPVARRRDACATREVYIKGEKKQPYTHRTAC